jgi:hypothetical protein
VPLAEFAGLSDTDEAPGINEEFTHRLPRVGGKRKIIFVTHSMGGLLGAFLPGSSSIDAIHALYSQANARTRGR